MSDVQEAPAARAMSSFGFSKVIGGSPWENPEGTQRNNPTS